jgi:uncharacterized protein YukE
MSNSTVLGASLETMNILKSELGSQSESVAALSATIDAKVKQTQWTGPAADRFRELWDGQFKQTLEQLRAALSDASTEVANRAEAIRVATA